MQARGNKEKEVAGLSCGDILAKTIREEYLRLRESVGTDTDKHLEVGGLTEITGALKCPDCGKALIKQGGCWVCESCGYSKCD